MCFLLVLGFVSYSLHGVGDFRCSNVNHDVGLSHSGYDISGNVMVNCVVQGARSIFEVNCSLRAVVPPEHIEGSQAWAGILEQGVGATDRIQGACLYNSILNRHFGVILKVVSLIHIVQSFAIKGADLRPMIAHHDSLSFHAWAKTSNCWVCVEAEVSEGSNVSHRGVMTGWILRPCNNNSLSCAWLSSESLTDTFDLSFGDNIVVRNHRHVILAKTFRLWRVHLSEGLRLSDESVDASRGMGCVKTWEQPRSVWIIEWVLCMSHLQSIDMLHPWELPTQNTLVHICVLEWPHNGQIHFIDLLLSGLVFTGMFLDILHDLTDDLS